MITTPKLPYKYDALEPTLSADTVKTHYDVLTKRYYDKTNELNKEGLTLDELITQSTLIKSAELYTQASQAWNHTMYWTSLAAVPDVVGPSKTLKNHVERTFNSMDKLWTAVEEACKKHVGSGWCWLVLTPSNQLRVKTTPNANNPTTYGETPLWCIDLWEHAFWLDDPAERGDYVKKIVKHLSWSQANKVYDEHYK